MKLIDEKSSMTDVRNWSKRNIKVRKIEGKKKVSYNVYAMLPNGKRIRQRFYNQLTAEEFAENCRVTGINLKSNVVEMPAGVLPICGKRNQAQPQSWYQGNFSFLRKNALRDH